MTTFFATDSVNHFTFTGGSDTVSYINADGPVTVNLGNPGVNLGWALDDTYGGIKNVTGTQYQDVLSGDNNANTLDGAGSADTIHAGGGNDTVLGGSGSDLLYGEDGNDLMDGQWQKDNMSGGNGDD